MSFHFILCEFSTPCEKNICHCYHDFGITLIINMVSMIDTFQFGYLSCPHPEKTVIYHAYIGFFSVYAPYFFMKASLLNVQMKGRKSISARFK